MKTKHICALIAGFMGSRGLVARPPGISLALLLAAAAAQASLTGGAAAQAPEGDDIATTGEASAQATAEVAESTERETASGEASTTADASAARDEAPSTVSAEAASSADKEASTSDSASDVATMAADEATPVAETGPSGEPPAATRPGEAKPPLGFKTGPALVLAAGTLSGIGIGYRQFYGRFGLQLAGIGVMFDDGGFASAGLQLYYTILRKGVARFYGLLGGAVYHDYDRDVDLDTTTRETTIFAGAGLGVSIEIPSGFLLALELPMHAVIRTHNSRFLVTPGVNASIGYAF